MNINISPFVIIDLTAIQNDLLSTTFTVTDDFKNPINFSGTSAYIGPVTFAKLTIRSNESSTEIISFSSTGSSYVIGISKRNLGQFTLSCNSLAVTAGGYLYDLQLSNATQKLTVMKGKFTVTADITS